MFGKQQFKFSIGAKINECFASIYHDEVKDGPMRPTLKAGRKKEGMVSRPTFVSLFATLSKDYDDNDIYLLRFKDGLASFEAFNLEMTETKGIIKYKGLGEVFLEIDEKNISYFK